MAGSRIASKVLGGACILVGFLLNPWLIGYFMAADGVIDSRPLTLGLMAGALAAVAVGILLITTARRRLRFRLQAAEAAILVTSLAAAVLIVEAALRIQGLYAPPPNPIVSEQSDLYQASDEVGYRLWPNTDKTYSYPAGNPELIRLVSNSDGFRSAREFDEPDDRRRILVVGDSFIFGQGVHAEDRITNQLEAMEPEWRVDNLGMTGWGLDLMIRALERYGPKADPDIVVLAVYTDDFRRLLPYYAGAGFAYTKFELDASGVRSIPYPYPAWWERARVVQALYQTWWERDRNRFDLNRALLDRYLSAASTIGFTPAVMFIPGDGDTPEDQRRRGFLREWSLPNGVPYVDLTTTIHSEEIESVYITDNWHWNARGHAIAAEALHDFLRSEVIDSP